MRSDLPVARLLAFGGSLTVHLLVISAVATLPDHRSEPYGDLSPALTVVSLVPVRPAAKPTPVRKAEELGTSSKLSSSTLAKRVLGNEAPVKSGKSSAIFSPPESEKPQKTVVPDQDVGPSHFGDDSDKTLRDYEVALWRKIDTNRPRGVNLSGSVLVVFKLSPDGELFFANISQTSGNVLLDKIALRSVRLAAPFPRPPKGIPDTALAFKISINFR